MTEAAVRRPAVAGDEPALRRGLAVGFLAMAPLFLAYELGVRAGGPDGPRNAAEVLLSRVVAPLGEHAAPARAVALVVLGGLALAHARLAGARVGRGALRIAGEGAAAALLLGPLLVLLLRLLELAPADVGLEPTRPRAPELAAAARLFGAGAWEELLFRVGLYGALFVLARRLAAFLGAGDGAAEGAGDAVALALSSFAFAAFHLEPFARLLGAGGEAFDPARFAWRALAGVGLGLLFRWRGPGVAAWAHGALNLELALATGPGVLA